MISRTSVLAWNGIALVGSLGFALFNVFCDPPPFSGLWWYWIPVAMLGVAQWLAYRERYGVAAILMFLGGLGTVPIGLLAIMGGLRANRMKFKTQVEDGPKPDCLRCGYNLHGAPGPRCPECGYVIAKWDAPRSSGHN